MAAKKVWLTWLPVNEQAAQEAGEAVGKLKKVGLQPLGALWNENLEKFGWTELGGHLASPEGADIWVIVGRRADLIEDQGRRYGLSLVRAMARDLRGSIPTVVVGLDFAPKPEELPFLLRDATCLDGKGGAWAAKVLVAARGKIEAPGEPYRLGVLAHEYFGQWFEVGPREGSWTGAMFGVAGEGAEIIEHAVGKKSDLPERTVLEYPTVGIQAEVGGTAFTACAVQNAISTEESYWLKVRGNPTALMFGGNPFSDDQEVWRIDLV